jgi:PAS domain S-box-containing protein
VTATAATLRHVASRGVIQSAELRRLAQASLPDVALLLLDERLRIAGCAGAVRETHGREADELLGRPFEELLAPQSSRAGMHGARRALDGETKVLSVRPRSSPDRVLELKTAPLLDADVTGVIVAARDVTAERSAQVALADIERRYRRLAEESTELRRSNADLGRFAAVASHDLAEPLLLMRSSAEMLQEDAGDRLSDADRHRLDVIARNARKMQALIDALLSYAAVDRVAVGDEPVDMARVVDDTLTLLDARIAATGAIVRRGRLDPVAGDARLLGLLLQNLVSNAMKFCDGPPLIDISSERAPDGWRLVVADNGIGIPTAQLHRIFVMFERLDRRRYPGLGLGLATAQRIAEIHGGTMTVTSEEGVGSRFEVALPVRRAGG